MTTRIQIILKNKMNEYSQIIFTIQCSQPTYTKRWRLEIEENNSDFINIISIAHKLILFEKNIGSQSRLCVSISNYK